jgi:hypothetical protein
LLIIIIAHRLLRYHLPRYRQNLHFPLPIHLQGQVVRHHHCYPIERELHLDVGVDRGEQLHLDRGEQLAELGQQLGHLEPVGGAIELE